MSQIYPAPNPNFGKATPTTPFSGPVQDNYNGSEVPAPFQFAITPSDTATFRDGGLGLPMVTRGIYVGVGGNVAVVPQSGPVTAQNGQCIPVVYQNVPTGVILPIRVTQVLGASGGTTASGLVGLAG